MSYETKKYLFEIVPKKKHDNGVWYAMFEARHEKVIEARSQHEAERQILAQYGMNYDAVQFTCRGEIR
jgi:hypothetical protein